MITSPDEFDLHYCSALVGSHLPVLDGVAARRQVVSPESGSDAAMVEARHCMLRPSGIVDSSIAAEAIRLI